MLPLMRIEGRFLVRYRYLISFGPRCLGLGQRTYDPAPVMMQTCHQLCPRERGDKLTLCASLSLPVAILFIYDLVE
jgi:hypothetical protein